ncbi:MAG: hypothetical protein AAFU61_15590, partial [Pseudomonadota bacterium]
MRRRPRRAAPGLLAAAVVLAALGAGAPARAATYEAGENPGLAPFLRCDAWPKRPGKEGDAARLVQLLLASVDVAYAGRDTTLQVGGFRFSTPLAEVSARLFGTWEAIPVAVWHQGEDGRLDFSL